MGPSHPPLEPDSKLCIRELSRDGVRPSYSTFVKQARPHPAGAGSGHGAPGQKIKLDPLRGYCAYFRARDPDLLKLF